MSDILEETISVAENLVGAAPGPSKTAEEEQKTDDPAKKPERVGAIYEYYEILANGKAKCKSKNCGTEMSLTTTVLKRHLERKHTILNREYKQKIQLQAETEEPIAKKKRELPPGQTTISFKSENFYDKDSKRQKQLDLLAVKVLSIPSTSINFFSHNFVQKFINALDPKYKFPKSEVGLKNLMKKPVTNLTKKIAEILNEQTFKPSITADVWTTPSSRFSYLGVTLHYIDHTDCAIKVIFLGLKELTSAHTHQYIRETLIELLEIYGLEISDLFKIVSDNGSNFVAAFPDYEVLQAQINEKNVEESNFESENDDELIIGDSNLEEEEPEIFPEDDELADFEIAINLPKRVPCFAHALQNNLSSVLKEALEKRDGFKAVKALIRNFKKSHDASRQLQKQTNLSLITPAMTRWGYWICVLARFLELQKEIKNIARSKKWPFPDVLELEYLTKIYEIIKIYGEILEEVQSQKTISISSCYVNLKLLLAHLAEKKNTTECNRIKEIITAITTDLLKRFRFILEPAYEKFDSCFIIASILDPNYVSFLSEQDRFQGLNFLVTLISSSSQDYYEPSSELCDIASNKRLTSLQEAAVKLRMVNERQRRSSGPMATTKTMVERCVDLVLHASPIDPSQKIDTLAFWKNLSHDFDSLKKVAFEIFAVPCTSAPIERVFSQAAFATSRHRSNTQHNLLNDQLLYLNNSLLD